MSLPASYHRRRNVHTVGMWLFLAALTMLFASSMLGYVVIRLGGAAGGHVYLPKLLWLSTTIILLSSLTIQLALAAVQHEKQRQFRLFLLATLSLAVLFVIVQVPAMATLLRSHAALRAQNLHVYGLVFFLVLLHALHVVGGIAGLVRVAVLAHLGRFDHESHASVRHIAMYWHFLDIVWLALFGVLTLAP